MALSTFDVDIWMAEKNQITTKSRRDVLQLKIDPAKILTAAMHSISNDLLDEPLSFTVSYFCCFYICIEPWTKIEHQSFTRYSLYGTKYTQMV
jgi:hypothetical protein